MIINYAEDLLTFVFCQIGAPFILFYNFDQKLKVFHSRNWVLWAVIIGSGMSSTGKYKGMLLEYSSKHI